MQNTLLIGSPGTAKTSVVLMYSSKLKVESDFFNRINLSNATLPINFQESIESKLEKKSQCRYHLTGRKVKHVFIENISFL